MVQYFCTIRTEVGNKHTYISFARLKTNIKGLGAQLRYLPILRHNKPKLKAIKF